MVTECHNVSTEVPAYPHVHVSLSWAWYNCTMATVSISSTVTPQSPLLILTNMIIRLSAKLNTKLKGGRLTTRPLHQNSFADWSAHLFRVKREQLILVTNT